MLLHLPTIATHKQVQEAVEKALEEYKAKEPEAIDTDAEGSEEGCKDYSARTGESSERPLLKAFRKVCSV